MKSHRVRFVVVLVVACLLWLGGSSGASSYDYHPLQVGSHWEYYSTLKGERSMTIAREEVVLGITTRVRHLVEGDQVWENFWSKDSSGNLLMHGARNLTDSFAVAYVPPIKVVAAPLFLGKTWVTTGVQPCDLDGTPWSSDPADFAFQVCTEGDVTVPAGEFYAFGLAYGSGSGLLLSSHHGTFDFFGRRVADGQLAAVDAVWWYSDGVGVVQSCDYVDIAHAYQLMTYTFPNVSTQPTTWGRVKAMLGRTDAAR